MLPDALTLALFESGLRRRRAEPDALVWWTAYLARIQREEGRFRYSFTIKPWTTRAA